VKQILLASILLSLGALSACAKAPNSSVPTIAGTATAVSAITSTTTTPLSTTTNNASEEFEIRNLVLNFGQKIQDVSLLAPDAAQEIKDQYSKYVSPALLEMWMNNISKAPGRMVSSPWPDHIEITTLSKEGFDRYEITGNIIEVTSTEVINGGAAAKIPVRMVAQKDQGHWYITGFEEEK